MRKLVTSARVIATDFCNRKLLELAACPSHVHKRSFVEDLFTADEARTLLKQHILTLMALILPQYWIPRPTITISDEADAAYKELWKGAIRSKDVIPLVKLPAGIEKWHYLDWLVQSKQVGQTPTLASSSAK